MSILRFECFSGISGDMILGSLLDLGLSLDDLRAGLEKLNVKNFSVSARKVVKSGVSATKFDVERIIKTNLHSDRRRTETGWQLYQI